MSRAGPFRKVTPVSLSSRVGAGLGTALVAVSFASPAMADKPAPKPTMPASIAALSAKLPPFPGENATDAQIEAWFAQASKALGLPPVPGENATDAQVYAYVNALVKALGLPAMPAMNAPDSAYEAWAAKVAAQFGLPPLPGENATDAQWEAWFDKVLGMTGMPMPTMPGVHGHHAWPTKPGHGAKPAGPVVQTDHVATSNSSPGVTGLTGAAAAALAGAGVTIVMRRRASR